MKIRKDYPLTAEQLRELLDYDPETGVFTWKRKGWRWGKPVGAYHQGYIRIKIADISYYAHRLAWLWMTGEWPVEELDHCNGEKADNRFANLRQADRCLNLENLRQAMKCSSHGFLGVSPCGNRWKACINSRGSHFYLGLFDSPEKAHQAYLEIKRQIHEGCTI